MTIREAQNDWGLLDEKYFNELTGVRLISHEYFSKIYTEGIFPVEEIKPGWLSRLFSPCKILSTLIRAFEMLLAADKRTVIISNGSTPLGNYICLLNYYLFFRSRIILFWDSHIEPTSRIKKYFARRCFLGCRLATHWSKKQTRTHAIEFRLPEDMFIFLPYKANHSKMKHLNLPTLDYVFAGGNGKRDYKTLVEAVRGTDVTLIISTTKPEVLRTIENIPNVIPLAAKEPSYAKLMAASRFVVIPMISTGIKGGGEANFCNAMWHGKPVIAMDDMSADDYIIEGETGYIVPPTDMALLRKRILDLWNNPEKAERMGVKGQELTRKYFTQAQSIRRLVRLACLVGMEHCQHFEK